MTGTAELGLFVQFPPYVRLAYARGPVGPILRNGANLNLFCPARILRNGANFPAEYPGAETSELGLFVQFPPYVRLAYFRGPVGPILRNGANFPAGYPGAETSELALFVQSPPYVRVTYARGPVRPILQNEANFPVGYPGVGLFVQFGHERLFNFQRTIGQSHLARMPVFVRLGFCETEPIPEPDLPFQASE